MKKRYILLWVLIGLLAIWGLFFFGIIESNKVYNLTERFGISGNVVSYGTYENEEGIIKEFSRIYAEGLAKGEKTYIVVGNKDEIRMSTYEEFSQGEIAVILQDRVERLDVKENKYSLTKIIPQNNKVEIVINGENYNFDLKEGENVYLIISQDIE